MSNTHRVILAYALLAILAAGVAWAGAESYETLTAAPSESITGATGADSTTATTVISDRPVATRGNTTVAVSVDFSGSAADTCVVSCLLFHKTPAGVYTFLGVQTGTATAGAYVDAAGDNIAPIVTYTLASATHFEIRHAAPSTGNVDLRWWTYGAAPQ